MLYYCAFVIGNLTLYCCNLYCYSSLVRKQGEDLALPEVPTEPIGGVPEADMAELGMAVFLILYHNAFLTLLIKCIYSN